MRLSEVVKEILKGALVDILIHQFPVGYLPRLMELMVEDRAGLITVKQSCGCITTIEHLPKREAWVLTTNYANCEDTKALRKR